MTTSWNTSETFPPNDSSSSRLTSASTEPPSSFCSSSGSRHQGPGRKTSSNMTANSQPSHDPTTGCAEPCAAPWASFFDRTIDTSGCQESCTASQDSKAAICQHNPSPSQTNRDWMDFFFSKSNLSSFKDLNGSTSAADCETCLPTHPHVSPRSSHNLTCPSAPIPFESCSNDACSINHSSVASALAACCDLPHLTSPIRCTQSLPTACCADADAPSQPSCDPCTMHPSCTDVACSDPSCNIHLDTAQCNAGHTSDLATSHPHCPPQCDGQSQAHPHRVMDCHEPHVVNSAGQKGYEDLQQLLDCCYCSDGSFDPCCSDGKHAASGQVTPASADACLTPTTNCTDSAHCHQSSHGTSPSTTLTSFDGCRFPFPHGHSDNGGCIPPQATLCNHAAHATWHPHHNHHSLTGNPQMICNWTDCTQSMQGSHQGQFQQTSSTAGSGTAQWDLPAAVTPSSRPCDSSLCNESHVSNSRGAHVSSGSNPLNVLLNQLLQQHQASASPSKAQQTRGWNQSGENLNRKGEMLPPRSYSHSGIDDSISTAASSMSYSASTSRLGSPMTERSEGSTSTVTASSNHHPCGWKGCSEVFATHEDLTEHVADAHVGGGKSKYTCGWVGCQRAKEGKTFQQRQKILRHIQTHTGDRPFKCSVCSRRFSEQNTLSQHMRTHTREKPYICDFPGCNASFAVAGSLTIHKRSRHTLERPFVCNWPGCGRAFAESSNLTKHRRVHSGEKPFPCKLCDRKFSRPDQLARHMKVHTGHTVDGASSTASSPLRTYNNNEGFASSPGQMAPLVEDASTTGLRHMQLGLAVDRTTTANNAIWGGI